jgi:hypothetical protein
VIEFKKRKLTKEELDDRKFSMAMEGERFRKRIEREANEVMLCPYCYSHDWKMQPKYLANIVANDLIATMVCRKCKRKMLFSTWIDEPYPEDDVDDADSEDYPFGILGIPPRHRRRKLDIDQHIRLLRYL